MLYLKRLMGHSTGLENSYFKPTDAQILEGNDKIDGYIAAIADLTINPTEEENQKLKQASKNQNTAYQGMGIAVSASNRTKTKNGIYMVRS